MVYIFVQQLVEALVDSGVKISVIAPQSVVRSLVRKVKLMPKYQFYQTAHGNSYEVYRPYSLTFGNGRRCLSKIARAYNQRNVNRCLNEISPQIVYGHFWHNAMKGAEYAQRKGKPLFVACGEGDDILDNWAMSLSDSVKEGIRKLVKGVISVSTENKRKCIAYGLSLEENTVVLPNCVNDLVFYPQDGSQLRKQLGAKTTDFVISYTGAFITRKGSKRLSDAIDVINKDTVKVIFAGQPLDGDNQTPTCKGIIYCDSVNHDELPQYLCASDVFVLPTLKEGCCNAIVEALACGVPVISSNRAYNDDILNESNSLRVNPESVDEIAGAIIKLMTDNNLLSRLKRQTLANSSNYSIVRRAENIRAFIESKI